MNKTSGITAITKDALNSRIKEGGPLQLLNVSDRQYYSLGVSSRRIPLAELKRRFSRARRIQSTRDLLHRYFVLRVAQSRGSGG